MKKLTIVFFLLALFGCGSSGGGDGDTTNPTTYSITGQITSSSTGLAGVTVSLSGASTAETTTDSSGNYSFTGQSNGNYTVTPSLSEYLFSPVIADVTVDGAHQANIDFTATASTTPTYSISGNVSGAVQSGVTITLNGTSSGSTLTDSSGNYSFSGIANGNYTITASKTGYTFSPIFSITVNNANLTGQNFNATANTTPTYSISGNVSGAVQSGVTITLNGTSSGSTLTDSSGNYSFSGIANGNYTITASKTGYTFSSPISITVNNANITGQNFTATANTYSISGNVSGAVQSGVTITLNGTSSGSTLTDSSGNYSFSGIANGNYTITASKTGYTFSPIFSITVNNANITGQNFTATATFQISLTTSYAAPINYGTIYVREIFVNVTGTPSLQPVTLHLIRNESGGHLSSSTVFSGKVYYYAGQLEPDQEVIDIIQGSIENVNSNNLVVRRKASF